MRAVTVLVSAIIVLAISVIAATTAYMWAAPRIAASFEAAEAEAVQVALADCNDRIVETARTGIANRCLIPADRGRLTAETDGLYYSLLTAAPVCDPTADWVSLEPAKRLELKCSFVERYHYELRWRWPSEIAINGTGLAGMGGFVGMIGTEDCPFEPPPPPASPPYPPCPEPDIKFEPTDVEFETVTMFVEFETIPGARGKIVSMSRVSITPYKIVLKVELT